MLFLHEGKRRTDDGFRKKIYGKHHKTKFDSPFLKIQTDMIDDFPPDALHAVGRSQATNQNFGGFGGGDQGVEDILNRCKNN